MTAPEPVYTIDEAAELLRVAPSRVRALTKGPAPKLGFIPSGRTVTIPESAIDLYIQTYKVDATPPNQFGLTAASARRIRKSA